MFHYRGERNIQPLVPIRGVYFDYSNVLSDKPQQLHQFFRSIKVYVYIPLQQEPIFTHHFGDLKNYTSREGVIAFNRNLHDILKDYRLKIYRIEVWVSDSHGEWMAPIDNTKLDELLFADTVNIYLTKESIKRHVWYHYDDIIRNGFEFYLDIYRKEIDKLRYLVYCENERGGQINKIVQTLQLKAIRNNAYVFAEVSRVFAYYEEKPTLYKLLKHWKNAFLSLFISR